MIDDSHDHLPFLRHITGKSRIPLQLGDSVFVFSNEKNAFSFKPCGLHLPGRDNGLVFCTISMLFDGSVLISKHFNGAPEIFLNGNRMASEHSINLRSGDLLVFGSLDYSYVLDMNEDEEDSIASEDEDDPYSVSVSERARTQAKRTSEEVALEILQRGDLAVHYEDSSTGNKILHLDRGLVSTIPGVGSFAFRVAELVEWLRWLGLSGIRCHPVLHKEEGFVDLRLTMSLTISKMPHRLNNASGLDAGVAYYSTRSFSLENSIIYPYGAASAASAHASAGSATSSRKLSLHVLRKVLYLVRLVELTMKTLSAINVNTSAGASTVAGGSGFGVASTASVDIADDSVTSSPRVQFSNSIDTPRGDSSGTDSPSSPSSSSPTAKAKATAKAELQVQKQTKVQSTTTAETAAETETEGEGESEEYIGWDSATPKESNRSNTAVANAPKMGITDQSKSKNGGGGVMAVEENNTQMDLACPTIDSIGTTGTATGNGTGDVAESVVSGAQSGSSVAGAHPANGKKLSTLCTALTAECVQLYLRNKQEKHKQGVRKWVSKCASALLPMCLFTRAHVYIPPVISNSSSSSSPSAASNEKEKNTSNTADKFAVMSRNKSSTDNRGGGNSNRAGAEVNENEEDQDVNAFNDEDIHAIYGGMNNTMKAELEEMLTECIAHYWCSHQARSSRTILEKVIETTIQCILFLSVRYVLSDGVGLSAETPDGFIERTVLAKNTTTDPTSLFWPLFGFSTQPVCGNTPTALIGTATTPRAFDELRCLLNWCIHLPQMKPHIGMRRVSSHDSTSMNSTDGVHTNPSTSTSTSIHVTNTASASATTTNVNGSGATTATATGTATGGINLNPLSMFLPRGTIPGFDYDPAPDSSTTTTPAATTSADTTTATVSSDTDVKTRGISGTPGRGSRTYAVSPRSQSSIPIAIAIASKSPSTSTKEGSSRKESGKGGGDDSPFLYSPLISSTITDTFFGKKSVTSPGGGEAEGDGGDASHGDDGVYKKVAGSTTAATVGSLSDSPLRSATATTVGSPLGSTSRDGDRGRRKSGIPKPVNSRPSSSNNSNRSGGSVGEKTLSSPGGLPRYPHIRLDETEKDVSDFDDWSERA